MKWINIKYELPPQEQYVLIADCLKEYHVARITERKELDFYQETCLGELFCVDDIKKISDIYTGEETMRFDNRHPIYRALMKIEFEEVLRRYRKMVKID